MHSNKKLIKLLKSLKTDPEFGTTAQFRAELKKRLTVEASKAGYFITMPEFPQTGFGWWRPFTRASWGKLAWATTGIVLLVTATTTVMAQKSLPTQRLYPVKIFGEQMVMAAAINEWKPQIAAAIADRRLSEIHRLEGKEESNAMTLAVNNYREHLIKTEDFRDGAGEEWATGINRHWTILKQLEEKLEPELVPDAEPQAPTIVKPIDVKPTETILPQPAIDKQINEIRTHTDETSPEKEQPSQKDDQGLHAPEIRLTIPALQNLFP